tara:strand:+ start:478 stop:630 length:153 start_codon:yes stop_codon:yes gene_type:complete
MAKKSLYGAKSRKKTKNFFLSLKDVSPNIQRLIVGIRPLSKAQKRKGKTL